jgi:hypothetical protein
VAKIVIGGARRPMLPDAWIVTLLPEMFGVVGGMVVPPALTA